jgi:Domain of unknown function (DUF4192)
VAAVRDQVVVLKSLAVSPVALVAERRSRTEPVEHCCGRFAGAPSDWLCGRLLVRRQEHPFDPGRCSSMTNVLRIRSHAELIASIPHTLGFRPESSMVCLAFGDGPTARLDLPGSPEEMHQFLGVLTDVYLHRHHASRMALVAYGEDGRACMQALASLGQALASGDPPRPEIGPVIWVNGDHWLDLLQGTRGTVDASTRTRMEPSSLYSAT